MQKKIPITVVAVTLIVVSLTSILWAGTGTVPQNTQEAINRFIYPITAANKTYTVTLEANWDADNPPHVELSNGDRHYVKLHFLDGIEKNVTYTINIPSDLLWGNFSLVKKYYLQNPDSYIVSNNGTHISLQTTFDYHPRFSGNGYFEVIGTEGAW